MRLIKCGLIGFGAWARHHARAIASCEQAVLTAICARSEQSAGEAQAAYPHAKIYRDYGSMLAQEELDLCSVVLPSDQHFEAARHVLESNRHLLLEKPMALTVEHCRALVQLASARDKVLAIGHELRMSSLWGRAKQLITEGAIGKPQHVLIELWRNPYRLGSGGWRYDIQRVGNWILEEPIHFFDLARWYFQPTAEPVSVYAAGVGHPDQPELHSNFSAIVQFTGGAYATITQTLSGWEHHQVAKIMGTEGALWASWSGSMDRTFTPTHQLKLRRGDRVEEVAIPRPSGEVYELVDEVAAVVRAVQSNSRPPCNGEDGLWSTAMCLKAAESLQSGRPVSLKEL